MEISVHHVAMNSEAVNRNDALEWRVQNEEKVVANCSRYVVHAYADCLW